GPRGQAAIRQAVRSSDPPHWEDWYNNPQGLSFPRWLREQHPGEAAARYDAAPDPRHAERMDHEEAMRRYRNQQQYGRPTLEPLPPETVPGAHRGTDVEQETGVRTEPEFPPYDLIVHPERGPHVFETWWREFRLHNTISDHVAQQMVGEGLPAYYREWTDQQS